LGENFELKVSLGDKIKKGDLLAKITEIKEFCVNMADSLSLVNEKKRKSLIEAWKNKKYKQGDLMGRTGGFFSKKILCPISGCFVGVDEFFNMCFVSEEKETREIRSPVGAKVKKIDKKELVLEFEAVEFKGKTWGEEKIWSWISGKEFDRIADLDSRFEGKTVLCREIDEDFLAKARALGVVALITEIGGKEELPDADMAILGVDKENWSCLMDELKDGKEERRMFLNCSEGKLLLVV